MPHTDLLAWLCLTASVLIVAIYQLWVSMIGRKRPERIARMAHGQIRSDWAEALAKHHGTEILAVQTLRNSLMSSTIVASTAALASLATLSLAGPTFALGGANPMHFSVRSVLILMLLATFFASFVASAIAMRYFTHTGYMMGFPRGEAACGALTPVAAAYVRRAGHHYSWSLRLFFFVGPLVVGLLFPLAMPIAAIGLIVALRLFDMPSLIRLLPQSLIEEKDGDASI